MSPPSPIVTIERLGGVAGFGGAHLRSDGTVDPATLGPADRSALAHLFAHGSVAADATTASRFRYRLSRSAATGVETIEVPETLVPPALVAAVHDRIE